MFKRDGALYTLMFALVLCLICAATVSSVAVVLKPKQLENQQLDKQKNILSIAGLISDNDTLDPQKIDSLFKSNVKPDKTQTGLSVFQILKKGQLDMVVIPIEGKGLWSTLYGFLGIDADGTTVRGISFYKHGETPGLGGEVDNPNWKAGWVNRKAMDKSFTPIIAVIKGKAGSPKDDPHHVDGLSGATLTSNGVTKLVQHWLGDKGYGPYLLKIKTKRGNK